jgi:glutamyl-tRNA synthetase
MAVAALAVLIGTSENVAAIPTMEELARHFDLAATSRSASKFDPAELSVLNKSLLHHMPFAAAKDRLAVLGIVDARAEAFWNMARGNLDTFADIRRWWDIVTTGPRPAAELSVEDRDFVRDAYDFLPLEPWNHDTWKIWTERVKEQSGRKGKALYLPLRLALTGLSSGPELSDLLPILGREATLARRP